MTEPSPDLDPRFCQPVGWRWHGFERVKGRYVRFGSVSPKNSIPDAVVVCLPGVREFSEKYFELAQWCLDHNLSFWIIDWAGQGKSTRLIKADPDKRHSHGFHEDVEDLRYFVKEYIKHSSVHPDVGRIPMAMIGHGAGAHIGLHYLASGAEGFECACFNAPLFGFKIFEKMPQSLGLAIASLCSFFAGTRYVPKGNNWEKRKEHANLTSDKARGNVERIWAEHIPELRCGDVTCRWIYEAQRSCMQLKKAIKKAPPSIPCLFSIPDKAGLIDNSLTHKVAGYMPDARMIDYPESGHEIFMENDEIRDNFLGHFYALVKETIIDRPETLKPF
jgi:lysophospholipase